MSTTIVQPAPEKSRPHVRTKEDTAQRWRQLCEERAQLRRENKQLREENERLANANSELKDRRFARRADVFRKVFPDFDAVVSAATVPEFIATELKYLDHGPDVAYVLGRNPALCTELTNLRPHMALARLHGLAQYVEETNLQRLINR